jgi:ParB-like chromosome segregation protein Spo0J
LAVTELDERVAQSVSIGSLRAGDSPRLNGVDPQHIQLLAGSDGQLPPILVHRASMRVLDGAHRVQAAVLKGQKTVDVIFFDGTDDEAFVAAIKANIAHGLPLTLADRQAAAQRLLTSHPQRSDRWVAAVVGLAAGTVGAIRTRMGPSEGSVTARIGRDGRARPISSANGRKLAGSVLSERPDATLREVARIAGISVGTARDVRERIKRGDEPSVTRQSQGDARRPPTGHSHSPTHRAVPMRQARDCPALLQNLNSDPSLRYTETGRVLLRWLHVIAQGPGKGTDLINVLPPHCMYSVTQILRHCASQWLKAADQLEAQLNYPQPEGVQLSKLDTRTRSQPQSI